MLNGNSVAVSLPDGAEKLKKERGRHEGDGGARAEGGDTSAKSGDAYGGDGGDAKATGGDAGAWNEADAKQANEAGERHRKGRDEWSSLENGALLEQGDPEAEGGKAKAEGGDGGDADTGNVQFGNGNALSFGKDRATAEGGDTCAESGDAYGGDGGDARASAATPSVELARGFQLNAPWKGGEL